MDTEAQDINTKRLSFGDVAQQVATQAPNVQEDVIKALKHPSVDNFQKAVTLLHQGYEQRFNTILETAKEQSDSVGDADLRRLKRQFSSLKNTFLHYEVKEEFIAALADGLPNGTEEVQLAQFEEEVNNNIQQLRSLKANNEEAQEVIAEFIREITGAIQGMDDHRTQASTILERLHKEVERHEAELAELPAVPEIDPNGLGEEACQEALAAAAAETRELEASIAQYTAEATELESAVALESQEVEVLRAQVADLRANQAHESTPEGAQPKKQIASKTFEVLQWTEQATTLLNQLGGMSIIEMNNDMLSLQVTTSYPTAAVAGGTLGACSSVQHQLNLRINPSTKAVVAVEISPADVVIDDVVSVCGGDEATSESVVTEVRSRLAGYLHRKALFSAAQGRFSSATCTDGGDYKTVKADLPGKAVSVELSLVNSWPQGDDVVEITSVNGAVDAEKCAKLVGLVLEGRAFGHAFDEAIRVLAASS